MDPTEDAGWEEEELTCECGWEAIKFELLQPVVEIRSAEPAWLAFNI